MRVALKPYGERGILAYDLCENERAGLSSALKASLPETCLEYVEGYDTVLFLFEKAIPTAELNDWLETIPVSGVEAIQSPILEIPVVYDGPDLGFVADKTGLSVEKVIEIHSSAIYSVRMMGFSPGFPYLDGLDQRLQISRKESPRKRIEPGAVAIGGPHAGVYSVASPGGWHILGRTELPLFQPEAALGQSPDPEEVFLISPGERLRFKGSV